MHWLNFFTIDVLESFLNDGIPHFSVKPFISPQYPDCNACFEVKTNLRSYYLMAETETDRDTWVNGLHNSMKFWKVTMGGKQPSPLFFLLFIFPLFSIFFL